MKKGVVCSVLNFENGEQLANLNNLRVNVGHFGNSQIVLDINFSLFALLLSSSKIGVWSLQKYM